MSDHTDTPDPLAAVILHACDQAIEQAAAIADPLERARALERAAEAVPEVQQRLRGARADSIREARRTMTAAAVAEQLGVSRVRLYQILGD